MGILYKSVDPQTQRPVALKTLRRDLLDDADAGSFCRRLRLEGEAARGLTHPGIVAVYDHGEADGRPYVAMEYVEGRSLQKHLDQGAVFSVPRAVDIARQLLEALQYAHDRGVWHRDVKPSNIILTSDGRIKLTDFGIARIASPESGDVAAILGTPGYIAPETYLSDEFDWRVDVFAAGAVLYQLLTGTPPFAGAADAIMFKVCSETPAAPSVAGRSPSLARFDTVVRKALARRPEERFAGAAQFRDALLQAHGQLGEPQAGNQSVPRRNP